MKVYSFFTDSHKIFYKSFTESFPFEEGFDLELRYFQQDCESGEYMSHGWLKTMRKKVEYILYSLENIKINEVFIHSDIDVVFYKKIKLDILNLINKYDILFQKEGKKEKNSLCMGFFACVKNEMTVGFFREIFNSLYKFKNDQEATNTLIKQSNLRYDVLPDRYYSIGFENGLWNGCDDIKIPETISIHHANWAIGIDKKLQLMNLVREKINDRK